MGMLSQKEQNAVDNLKKKLPELLCSPEVAYDVASSLFDDLVDEMILGIVFETHRAGSMGLLEPEADMSGEDSSRFQTYDAPDLDVFGQPPIVKKFQDCICPSCNRALAASRFAPHLEKCMGMGRNSSRIASRRIANNSKESSNVGGSEDEDDVEWSASSDKRRKRRDRSNGCSKRPSKTHKSERRNGDSVALAEATPAGSVATIARETVTAAGATATAPAPVVPYQADLATTSAMLDKMRPDDRRALLSQICGVVSEHTRKLCTRSLRCPQHTDEQKRALRASLTLVNDTSFQAEIQVNVESLGLESDDVLSGIGGLGSLGGLGPLGGLGSLSSLGGRSGGSWEAERSNASSPADSGSVGSSTSSKKREKASPAKVNNHKKKTSKHSSSLE